MSDMFYTYDNIIEKPLKKQIAGDLNPSLEESLTASWLKNVKGNLIGVQGNADSDLVLYFSLEISGDSRLIDEFITKNRFYCEFLNKSYEVVLTKLAIKYYTGILAVNINAGELVQDNYHIRLFTLKNPKSAAPGALGASEEISKCDIFSMFAIDSHTCECPPNPNSYVGNSDEILKRNILALFPEDISENHSKLYFDRDKSSSTEIIDPEILKIFSIDSSEDCTEEDYSNPCQCFIGSDACCGIDTMATKYTLYFSKDIVLNII